VTFTNQALYYAFFLFNFNSPCPVKNVGHDQPEGIATFSVRRRRIGDEGELLAGIF